MTELNITPDDLQVVMQADPIVALKLQLTAAMRRIAELEAELARNGHGDIKAESPEDSQAWGSERKEAGPAPEKVHGRKG